jgi:hypothetical protein
LSLELRQVTVKVNSVNLIILKHNLTLMQGIFTSHVRKMDGSAGIATANVPWSGHRYKNTSPRAFYVQILELKVLNIEEASEDFQATVPLVDMTQPIISERKPFQVVQAEEVSFVEAPRKTCVKYICTFWHPKVSITNEKMYLWSNIDKAYKNPDPTILEALISEVDGD